MDICIAMFRSQGIEEEVVSACYSILKEIFIDCHIELLNEVIVIPDDLYNQRRNQYLADGVTYMISGLVKTDCFRILLAGVDAYIDGTNFVFGLAIPWLRSATVFLYRLKLYTDFSNYLYRVQKEVIHEFGHLLGLEHCRNPRCVMSFSNSVYDVDKKSHKFCGRCAKKLKERGFRLST